MSDDGWTAELRRRWDEGIVRYPDPAVEVLDPRFGVYRLGNAAVERLYTGARWAEGPVWFAISGHWFSAIYRTTGCCATAR